ncbi:FecR family protein [Luteimonas sp. XNQY3]|nr:FecR family protein [Luteimonas sp. XNQY3]MCD9004979.1 FecR family protein [Luteimonas sp. XNQY3]
MSDDDTMQMKMELDPDDPMDQALVWVSRIATGEADANALAEFERWRDSDARHEKALNEARRLWLMLGEPLEAQYAPVMASLPATAAQRQRTRRRRAWRPALATAAALLLAVALGDQWHRDWRYDQTTGTGEQRTIALADGSTMWLNTGSAADVQVDEDQRHVHLARGEAYFDVAHDPQHPFTVDAGNGHVTVLGTAFGVRREGEHVVVTVQRGRVRVAGGDASAVFVTADEQVRIHPGEGVAQIEAVSAEQALSWRTGRLQFENRRIGEVLDELKRYDRRLMLVSYPQAEQQRVSSIVDLARLDEWYDTLEQSLPVKVTRIGPVVWIHAS